MATDAPAERKPTGLIPPGQIGSRVKDADRTTRKPLEFWDRAKFLVLLALLFGALYLQVVGLNPIKSSADAFRETATTYWWLTAVAAVEIARQLHFLVAERWSRYYLFFRNRIFGGTERLTYRFNPWLRYRMARAFKWSLFIAVLAVILGGIFDEPPVRALITFPARFVGWLPLILQLLLYMSFFVLQFVAMFWFLSRGGVETYFPEDIDTRFDDVWGQDHVVERVKENLIFLENPESIEGRGGYTPGGILLWGPPGTGKTLMAEAAAGETGKPFVFVEPGAFQAMFFGIGILKVKSLYRKLRKLSLRYGGVVVFFDEADSLGNRGMQVQGGGRFFTDHGPGNHSWDDLRWLSPRSAELVMRDQLGLDRVERLAPTDDRIMMMGGAGGGGMGTLQALLTEMSGLKKPRGFFNRRIRKMLGMRPKPPPQYRILHMMATNLPDVLDPALLRPGRIDRMYRVGFPAREGRERTFHGYLDKVRHDLTDTDVEKLARISPYASGAVIKDMVNEALILAIREGREVITWNDLIRAKRLKRMGPPEDVEYIERERHAVAVHEACHAVSAAATRHHLTIDIATIEKGGTYLGMVSSVDPDDRYTQWRSEYESDIVVSLASLAGERYFFGGDNSSGVSGDLESATAVATYMIGYWGMGDVVASHRVQRELQTGGGQPKPPPTASETAERLRAGLGDQIEQKLTQMLRRAESLLARHRTAVLAVAHALESHKTISGDDVAAIMERRRGPLFDGAAYYTPEAVAALESYHEEAARAHREHLPFELSLPAIVGLYPDDLIDAEVAEVNVDEAALIGAVAHEVDPELS